MRLRWKYRIALTVWVVLTPLAFLLRLEDGVLGYGRELFALTVAGLLPKALALLWIGFHRRAWSSAGVSDLLAVGVSVAAVTVAQVFFVLALYPVMAIPRSIPFIEGAFAVLALGGGALTVRLAHERARARAGRVRGRQRRVLIVGAGDAGVMVAREMRRHPEAGLCPVGFLDDGPNKLLAKQVGLSILGPIEALPTVVDTHGVDEVLIAMPSQSGEVLRRVVGLAREAGCPSRTLPAIHDLVSGRVSISSIREVKVEDLLRRAPVRMDQGAVGGYLHGRVVLVTGAGGSIGSEIVRQVAAFEPAEIVLLGRGENSIFEIDRELARTHPRLRRHPVICDVRDVHSLEAVFEQFRPEVVFHAAAHKHVPLMEANPAQAVLNNVGGTRNLVTLALEYGVVRFVNVSTDKAVNPTSVMGASKRVAEGVVAEAGSRCKPGCAFVSVRFGNVLGSRGSVIPVFKDQIRRGGPVMVTHPEMQRYFMTIPEASQLVLQAGATAENGRIYVLDMGKPVRIEDLARDLILLSGLEPGRDVEIGYSGLRPGEKLFEELLTAEEGTDASHHEKIFVARKGLPADGWAAKLDRLFAAAEAQDEPAVRAAFRALVPTFKPDAGRPPGGDGAPAAASAPERWAAVSVNPS